MDGVILGVDTRATERPIVADKNCEKIHFMVPNIYCCGAGTATDAEAVFPIAATQVPYWSRIKGCNGSYPFKVPSF
ncbi:unnamed protein product [Camellia sinensis]